MWWIIWAPRFTSPGRGFPDSLGRVVRGIEMKRQPGLFDVDERLKRLSDIGDQLEAFSAVVTSRCSSQSWRPP